MQPSSGTPSAIQPLQNAQHTLPASFSGVVPAGFSGVMSGGEGRPTVPVALGPNSSSLPQGWVKEAVLSLRSKAASLKRDAKESTGSAQPESSDFYKALQVKKGCSEDEIKKSYRKLVLKWHPDKHPSNREEADEKIRLINNAYEILGNPLKRAGYNQMLEALERKKRNQRLETAFIQPRMSIPKAFMLSPLGFPDKFLRWEDTSLRIQSRDDARGVHFDDFFRKAQFSLWHLPEVNNMCRMRVAEYENSRNPIGMNLQVLMEGAPIVDGQMDVKESETGLTPDEDPRYCNLIVVASPFSQGAFRFEGAFWPGHYLTYRAPCTFCMAPLIDEVKDITDFYLVDFSTKFKHLTVGEVLAQAMINNGGAEVYVGLGGLRSDSIVRAYFQNILGCSVWNNKDLGEFFEGHYQQFDFDKKRARVRLRSPKINLIEQLQRCKLPQEVATAILSAGQELLELPIGVLEGALERLASPDNDNPGLNLQQDVKDAQKRILGAVPVIFGSETGTPLPDLFKLYHTIAAVPDGASENRDPVCLSIVKLVNERIQTFPDELDIDLLTQALELPLAWEEIAENLRLVVASLVTTQKRPAGSLLKALTAMVKVGKPVKAVAEALARAELQVLHFAPGATAAAVLHAVIDNGLLAGEVAMKLLFLQNVPLNAVIHAVFQLRKHGLEITEMDSILKTKVFDLGGSLEAVPGDDLVRLFEVAERLNEKNLTNIINASIASLGDWSVDSIVKLLTMVVSNKDWGNTDSANILEKLGEVLTKKTQYLNVRLLATALATVISRDDCISLLDALAEDAQSRLTKLEAQDLVIIAKAILPLDKGRDVCIDLRKCLTTMLSEASISEERQVKFGTRGEVSSDELAAVVQFLAKVPIDDFVCKVAATLLEMAADGLTDVGHQCIENSNEFSGREKILEVIKAKQARKDEERKREEERKKEEEEERKREDERKKEEEDRAKEEAARMRQKQDPADERSRSPIRGVSGKTKEKTEMPQNEPENRKRAYEDGQREERRRPHRREERRRDDRRENNQDEEWEEFRRDDRRQARRREDGRGEGRRDHHYDRDYDREYDRGRLRSRDDRRY